MILAWTRNPDDVSRAEVEKGIQKFLADFFADLQDIIDGNQPDWEYHRRVLHPRLRKPYSWPVKLTAEYLWLNPPPTNNSTHLLTEWMASQGWMVIRNDPKVWRILMTAQHAHSFMSSPTFAVLRIRPPHIRRAERAFAFQRRAVRGRTLFLHFQKTFQKAVKHG